MKKYCLDSNVFIEAWNRYWSVELCPDYWSILDELGHQGVIVSPIEVRDEIAKADDGLHAWIKNRDFLFRDVDGAIQQQLRRIMRDYPRLVDSIKQRSVADPWVIALALAEDATVVTKELPVGSRSQRIRIPDVCEAFDVKWMSDFSFARAIGIRFSASIQMTAQTP